MANCITLVRMVIAPTATSPPYFSREELKHTEIMLSLACMTKVESPRARLGRKICGSRRRNFLRIFNCVFFPKRKESTQAQEIAWERIVARAAPRTPRSKPKIKTGSRIIFATAPMSTENMPVLAKPWAVMKVFMPSVICTKMVPMA